MATRTTRHRYASDARKAADAKAQDVKADHTWTYVAVVVLLFSCFMMFGGVKASLAERDLIANGRIASATITDLKAERSNSDSGSSTTYYVTSTFSTTSGDEISGRSPVSKKYFNAARIGRSVEMLYLPGLPSMNSLEPNGRWWMFGLMAFLLSLPFMFGSIWFLIGVLRGRRA